MQMYANERQVVVPSGKQVGTNVDLRRSGLERAPACVEEGAQTHDARNRRVHYLRFLYCTKWMERRSRGKDKGGL
jgi:hypothetical protein